MTLWVRRVTPEVNTHLVPLEVGAAARGEALLTAEALELAAHAQRVAAHTHLLAPGAHDLHRGRVLVWGRGGWMEGKVENGGGVIQN